MVVDIVDEHKKLVELAVVDDILAVLVFVVVAVVEYMEKAVVVVANDLK